MKLPRPPLPRVAECLLLAAIAGVIWQWNAAGTVSTPGDPAPLSVPARTRTDAAALATQLISRHLFGEAQDPAASIVDDTDSGFRLTGVFAAALTDMQLAILVTPDGRSGLYRRGEQLPNGSVLDEVGVDYVLIRQGSQRRRIALPHQWLGGASQAGLLAGTAAASASGRIDEGTASTLSLLGLSTASAAGNGAMALSGSGPSTWKAAGLRDSDVIVAIDGATVSSVLSQSGALDRAVQATVVTLTVERNGQQLDLQAKQPVYVAPRRGSRRV